jgi:hypothetical protein
MLFGADTRSRVRARPRRSRPPQAPRRGLALRGAAGRATMIRKVGEVTARTYGAKRTSSPLPFVHSSESTSGQALSLA